LIILYGLAVLLSGFINAAPLIEGVRYSIQEDKLHSLLTQAVGVLFSIGILSNLLFSSDPKENCLAVDTIAHAIIIGMLRPGLMITTDYQKISY